MADSNELTLKGLRLEGLDSLDKSDADHIISLIRTIPGFPAKGINFRDFIPVLNDGRAFSSLVEAIVQSLPVPASDFDYVGGLESRGFLLGAPLALRLHKGFLSFRKQGKLPPETLKQSYALEYGTATIEIEKDVLKPGDRVLVVDDLIATGGTAIAAEKLVEQAGARVVGFSFAMELDGLDGRAKLGGIPSSTLIGMPA